jgi:hypothetical protein
MAITKWSIFRFQQRDSIRPTAQEAQSPLAKGGLWLHEIKHDRFL